jgi:hypothetical protein
MRLQGGKKASYLCLLLLEDKLPLSVSSSICCVTAGTRLPLSLPLPLPLPLWKDAATTTGAADKGLIEAAGFGLGLGLDGLVDEGGTKLLNRFATVGLLAALTLLLPLASPP